MQFPIAYPQENDQFHTYHSDSLGMSITYPSQWNVSYDSSGEYNCNDYCLIVLKNLNTSNLALSFYAKKCSCNDLLEQVKNQYTTYLEPLKITILKDNGVKLKDGTVGWQMEYMTSSKYNYVLWFIHDGFFYEINYYNNNKDLYSKYLPAIKSIINTIEFSSERNKIVENPSNGDKSQTSLLQQPSFMKPLLQESSFLPGIIFSNLTSETELVQNVSTSATNQNDSTSEIFAAVIEYYPAVTLEFISNSTIVLKGDEEFMLKTEGSLSSFWKTIDAVKQFGYILDEVTESGLGSNGNPTRFYAIMSLDTYPEGKSTY